MVMQRFLFFIIDNKSIHILAQFTKQIEDFIVWMEKTPSLIKHACTKIPNKKKSKDFHFIKGSSPKVTSNTIIYNLLPFDYVFGNKLQSSFLLIKESVWKQLI